MSDPNASSGTLEFGPSPLDCIVSTGPAGPGQYRWAEAGGTLTFTVVKDDCIDRVLVLTTVKWTKGA